MKPANYRYINLTTGTTKNLPIKEGVIREYLGGKILAAKLLYKLLPKGVESLSPENLLIINTGLLTGTGAPSSSRFNMTFKNVMTGGIASSNCGGTFGMMLRRAGVEGLIIAGKAEKPIFIEVMDGEIFIKDAAYLWGMNTEETQKQFESVYGKLVIGPAGENQVRYACAVSGERVAGRCGAGAVMGSKNLKAVVAYGSCQPEIYDRLGFDAYVKKWVRFLKNHPMTGDSLGHYGTAGLVSNADASHALPTHNFSTGHFEEAEAISGERLAETLLTRNSGCVSCPIRCERRVMVDDKEVKGPEYETLGLLGSNINNSDLDLINRINYQSDLLGLDTISLAGTLAFCMELQEKGMMDFGISFGDTENLMEVIDKIAHREGIYAELAEGSAKLSEKYGGKDFAIHAKGLELAAYEPRRSVGMGLGYATSNRGGCHLNGGYLALMESVGVMSVGTQGTKGKPELTIFMQNGLEAGSAAGFCLFTMQTMIPSILYKMGPTSQVTQMAGKAMILARGVLGNLWPLLPSILPINSMYLMPHCKAITLATGIPMTTGRFLQIGERGFNIERLFNLREGLTAEDDTLPSRLTQDPQDKKQQDTVVNLDVMMPIYYKVRGWDKKGLPKSATIKRLRLESL